MGVKANRAKRPHRCLCRPIRQEEHPLLEEYLYEAIFVPPGSEPPPRSITAAPELRVYVEQFGRRHDHALVAESEGKIVGAAWARIMQDYGHVDDTTPSLALAVHAAYRGQGIGTALLQELLRTLTEAGYAQASLSVQKANPAIRLYRRMGFTTCRENAEDLVMLRQLRPGLTPPAARN